MGGDGIRTGIATSWSLPLAVVMHITNINGSSKGYAQIYCLTKIDSNGWKRQKLLRFVQHWTLNGSSISVLVNNCKAQYTIKVHK